MAKQEKNVKDASISKIGSGKLLGVVEGVLKQIETDKPGGLMTFDKGISKSDINVEGGVTGFNPIGRVAEGDKRAVSGEEVFDIDEINKLNIGEKVKVSASKYVKFKVKQNDVLKVTISDYEGVPPNANIAVSLTVNETIDITKTIVANRQENGVIYNFADRDYNYIFFYRNPQGLATYSANVEITPFERIQNWILSEAYTISNITYDTYGNVKTAQLTYPDGTGGAIQTSTSDADGRLLTIIFTYGSPFIIRIQMTITYLGDLVNTLTINRI